MIIEGYNPPTISTPGNVGDKYVDLSSGSYYECTAVNPQRNKYGFITIDNAVLGTTEYVWEELYKGVVPSTGKLLEFDGNLEGREYVDNNGTYMVKMSDKLYSVKDLADATYVISRYDGNEYHDGDPVTVSVSNLVQLPYGSGDDASVIGIMHSDDEINDMVCTIVVGDTTGFGLPVSETGVYFIFIDKHYYVKSVSCITE